MTQSKPAKEHWIDLARQAGEMGREDCQEGWHRLAASLNLGTVLDVGAGLGLSGTRIPHCTTQDPGPGTSVDLRQSIEGIPAGSFDSVTAFDVIEHVAEDVDFLQEMHRIARRCVFVTTPNFNVSRAANGCHCREYTPQELVALAESLSHKSIRWWIGDGKGLRPVEVSLSFLRHVEPHQAFLLEKLQARRDSAAGDWPQNATILQPVPHGCDTTYQYAAHFLKDCDTVEDWGCGPGYFRKVMAEVGPSVRVLNVDGSPGPAVDVLADLAHRNSSSNHPEGILLRGVLEHNRCWQDILTNACKSLTKKLCLVFFIAPTAGDETVDLYVGQPEERQGYLGLTIPVHAIRRVLAQNGCKVTAIREFRTQTQFGRETVFEVTR